MQGSLGIGNNVGVDAGTWGAGVDTAFGVGDFYQQNQLIGANWYRGKYGYVANYGVPLLPVASVAQGVGVCVALVLT